MCFNIAEYTAHINGTSALIRTDHAFLYGEMYFTAKQ